MVLEGNVAKRGFWFGDGPFAAVLWPGRRARWHGAALVCLKGHVTRDDLIHRPNFATLGYCTDRGGAGGCGALVIGQCQHCGVRLRGARIKADLEMLIRNELSELQKLLGVSASRDANGAYGFSFCERCGSPHPWATRKQRLQQLENLVQAQQLGVQEKKEVVTALKQLEAPNLPPDAELSLWRTVLKHAPALKGPVGRITEGLLTAWIKQQLGL